MVYRAKALLCAAAIGLMPAIAAAKSPCTIDRASYQLHGNPQFTAGFRDVGHHENWQSTLAFFVRSNSTGKTYWFLFDAGTARYINLISTTDVTAPGWHPPDPDGGTRPLGELHYFAANADLTFNESLPKAGDAAPDHILLPDLSEVMAYKATPRETVQTAFFDNTGCAQSGK
ncbi:hypothetical protein [Nitrospirillum pindoramense]|uniref:Uncharacterized protein n=1 Tax=Nitrospirillum amazonense TaxID=28077 RepID=A0A560GTG6_9PROT|nr:hypothetical protein [Nitrospirillum amazonense]TWB37268.1 hypothetical protein FBZ90_11581 [Nitrospirillum amazonense]